MRKISLCLTCCILFFNIYGLSQSSDAELWSNIELSLRAKKNLETTRTRLLLIKQEAQNNQDAANMARAFCYTMLVDDQRTEDTLYFRNSKFIDSILLTSHDAGLNCYMHYLQAQRLWKFRKKYLKFNKAKYETKELPFNYAALSSKDIDSIINFHFEKAKQIAASLKEPPLERILWLSSTPLTFLFKPSLTDIIFLEQINFSRYDESFPLSGNKSARSWINLSQDSFIDTLKQPGLSNKRETKILSLYNQWLEANKKQPAAYYSIEVLARQYVYNALENDMLLQKDWQSYLKSLTQSKFPEVKARGIYSLCLLYRNWMERYASPSGNYYSKLNQPFDTAYQYYGVKALQLYDANRTLFDRFAYLKERLDDLKEMSNPWVQLKMNSKNEKAKPLLVKVEYKNVPRLYYRIVQLYQNENGEAKPFAKTYLLNKASIRREVITLPLPLDYNLHRTFLKIDSLPVGSYCLLFSYDSSFGIKHVGYQTFIISALAVLNTDDRVYVVNRTTGMPVVNAIANAFYTVERKEGKVKIKDTVRQRFATNAKGFFILPKAEHYTLTISSRGDTLTESANVEKDELSKDVFNKNDYDDLVDYYDENAEVEIFTDRAIYRPGQKVFYKALFITKDPKTGESLIMNRENLKKGFRNWLKKWKDEMAPLLYLHDPFGRVIDSVKINPDEYGTVSGEFIIPKTAATGEWQIEPDYLDIHGNNRGSFKVEEYKRPTFEITVDKPEKTFKIGDTVLFAIKLRSFAGSSLSHTLVDYSVERTNVSKLDYSNDNYTTTVDIVDTSAYTDEQGRLLIKIVDTALTGIDKGQDLTLNYRLDASTTDATGETHDVRNSIKVSTRPVVIRIPVYGTNNMNDLRPLLINTKDVNGLEINSILHAKLYRLPSAEKKYVRDYSSYADQWLYNRDELESLFKDVKFRADSSSKKDELVFETTINTEKAEKFRWPIDKIGSGKYRIEVTSGEKGMITGEASQVITIFDPASGRIPADDHFFFNLAANWLKKDDTLHLFSGSDFDNAFSILQLKYYSFKNKKKIVETRCLESITSKGVHEWKWAIPDNIDDRLIISEIMVAGNEVYTGKEDVDIADTKNQPRIIMEQFRTSLTPGAKTTYSVSVKTKNRNTAAQLMTTIYDASLDKLAKHNWYIPYSEKSASLKTNWPNSITHEVSEASFEYLNDEPHGESYVKPLWWMNGLAGGSTYVTVEKQPVGNPLLSLQGRVPGLMITNATGMDEVVISKGYYTETKRYSVGNVVKVRIQGINSIEQYKQPLIILDGVPYTGELSSLNVKEITEIMVLKDADATAIYGSRAAGGVLIISTKGAIKLPVVKQEPLVKVRSNFNETAFFSPAIYADKDGYYKFSFTMPESLTEWNWKLFAHTKKMQFAYEERKLVTQLPLMIQPHLPSMLYQGDLIILKSRISNLDTSKMNGKAECKIEDAVTGEDITSKLVVRSSAAFEAEAKSNTTSSFELKVPGDFLHPLKITLTAKTNEFADGEEHIIPVLSKQILVKQNQKIVLLANDTTVLKPASIDQLYGIEISIQPKQQAALINSLPFLAHYSYDCAEQTFNKMYAHIIALSIMRKDTTAQHIYNNVSAISKKQNAEVPLNAVSGQAMPWLSLSNKTAKEQTDLAEILDTLKGAEKIKDYLSKLYALQNTDGGMAWFSGGKSNERISFYILERFGKIVKDGWQPNQKEYNAMEKFDEFIKKLIGYCDEQFLSSPVAQRERLLYYCYARSLWKEDHPIDNTLLLSIRSVLNKAWANVDRSSLDMQSMLIVSTLRYFANGEEIYKHAIAQLNSIRQLAIKGNETGIRWKDIADSGEIGSSSEETLSYLLEAFMEAKQSTDVEQGIIKWILINKNEQPWHTTTGTAAVIHILQKTQGNMISGNHQYSAILSDTILNVSDNLLSGQRSAFHQLTNASSINLKKRSGEAVQGTIAWYYFSSSARPNELNKEVQLIKQISHFNEQTKKWDPVSDTAKLTLGEKVKITLTIETPKTLRYVFIDDKTAAALEPVAYNSGYEWGQDVSYYQSIRDAGRQFFAEIIPSGKTEINYEMVVGQEGEFYSGTTVLQCMYKPEIVAYSTSGKIKTAN